MEWWLLQSLAGYSGWILAGMCGLVVLVVVLRGVVHRRARRGRVTVALVPASTFDPSKEEILRFASQLARTHRVTARTLQTAGDLAVRVQLISAGEGRMAHIVSGPRRAESILKTRGFGQVELVDPQQLLKPVDAPQGPNQNSDGGATQQRETGGARVHTGAVEQGEGPGGEGEAVVGRWLVPR